MQAFKFGRRLTTVTVTPTPPSDHPTPVTFTAPSETTLAGAFTFPYGFAVSPGAVFPILDDSDDPCRHSDTSDSGCSDTDNDCAHETSTKVPKSPSKSRSHTSKTVTKTCKTTSSSTGSDTSSLSQTRPPTSLGSSATPSSTLSGSISSSPSTSVGSTTTSSSSLISSTSTLSTPLTASSISPVDSAANVSPTSTRSITTPPPAPGLSATATPAPQASPGLSAPAAVGLALGVFAAVAVLAAAAVFLFLFLRARRRKRRRGANRRGLRRDSSSADSATWKLTSSGSKGPESRPLSSTWSWFGSLAVRSEPDIEDKHGDGYGPVSSPYSFPRDVDGADPEKSAGVSDWVARTSVAVEDPGPHDLRQVRVTEPGGAPRRVSLSVTETTISTLRFGPSKPGKRAKDGLGAQREARRDGTGPPRDPFADPRRFEIVRMLTGPT